MFLRLLFSVEQNYDAGCNTIYRVGSVIYKVDTGLTPQCKEAQDGLNQSACLHRMSDGTLSRFKRRDIADSTNLIDTRSPRNVRVELQDGNICHPENHPGWLSSQITRVCFTASSF